MEDTQRSSMWPDGFIPISAHLAEKEALNLRIKRLEEAGDDLMIWRADPYSVALWRKAKEAKP
jgi:hypothetical protein